MGLWVRVKAKGKGQLTGAGKIGEGFALFIRGVGGGGRERKREKVRVKG